ncbi:hypothetical protein KDW_63470 [Dictyobacter vulcani]|uniref:Pyrroline-5-carboxylate reductase catalytic N-terminal domain-containing protein n=1 Tax=Dictyobacter vulcani TaxID=2607529 RepID=A0A5J4KW38_9CHLR|nr:NAD(P)-binding domain-containing protein [Dictyobacter vulcani]GER92185.1 hypothetical protein KDW_63470 [Dictyobacter vulcani]
MKFGVIGTGIVGRTLAAKLAELNHEVMVGTRDVATTLARTELDGYGNPSFSTWQQQHTQIQLGTFAQAAAFGEIVLNATSGGSSLEALKLAGNAAFNGKILIDVANPLDFSRGLPLRSQ